MKASVFLIYVFATLLLSNIAAAQSLLAVEEIEDKTTTLLEAIESFNLYFKNANVDKLDAMLTERYMHTNGASKPYVKEVWLNYIKSRKIKLTNGELIMDKYGMTEINVTHYDEVALVNGVVSSKGSEKGAPFDKKFRVTHLWVLENDQWKRAAFHDGVIQ